MNNVDHPNSQTPHPSIPFVIDSRDTEYFGNGVTSSVAIAGHPIHPIVVIFPVAFLTGAAGADIGYWLTQDAFWARASVWLIGLGLGAGILAAIIGMTDFFKVPRVKKRSAGWLHMLFNVSALLLTGLNFWLRSAGDSQAAIVPTGAVLSIIVATLLGLGGWYGGELSFRHKVGVIGPGETNIP